jgi:hypothetical protein
MRERTPARVAKWICVAWILAAAQMGSAAPTPCPIVGDASVCELVVGETRFVVAASDIGAGYFVIRAWEIGGVPQLAPGLSGFAFRDFSTAPGIPLSSRLEVATVDVETSEIFIEFRELVSGVPGASSLSGGFHVTHDGDTSAVTRVITVGNDGASTALSRVYDVMDLDLNETPVDDAAFTIPSGPMIFQADGAVMAETRVAFGPQADGYEVGLCPPCDLSSLLGDATFDLSNIGTVAGPADFQSALSWNQKLVPGGMFNVTVETSIVPEPGAAGGALGAVLTLLLCRRVGDRKASSLLSRAKCTRPATGAGEVPGTRGKAWNGSRHG